MNAPHDDDPTLLKPGETIGACEECGNDDPSEGRRYCTDCCELLYP